jgi:hypothetical protein
MITPVNAAATLAGLGLALVWAGWRGWRIVERSCYEGQ